MDKRHIQKFKHHHMYMQIHTNKLLFPSHDDHVIGTCSSYQLNHKVDCIRTCPYDDGEQVEMFFLCTTPWNAIFTKSLWYLVNVIEQHIIYWFQNVPTPHQTSTWKVLELKTFSILMESYEQGQAYQPLYESMNEHKISNKKKLHSYGYCTQAKKIKHWMTTLWGQKNNCLFWIQRLCEFQSCIAHNPLLEDLEIIAC